MLPTILPRSKPVPVLFCVVFLLTFVETLVGCGVGLSWEKVGTADGTTEGTNTSGISLWAISELRPSKAP